MKFIAMNWFIKQLQGGSFVDFFLFGVSQR